MGRIIECCVRNVDDEVSERLREGDDTVRIRPCLERCGVCRDRPFHVADGELVTGRHLPAREDSGKSDSPSEPSLTTAREDAK